MYLTRVTALYEAKQEVLLSQSREISLWLLSNFRAFAGLFYDLSTSNAIWRFSVVTPSNCRTVYSPQSDGKKGLTRTNLGENIKPAFTGVYRKNRPARQARQKTVEKITYFINGVPCWPTELAGSQSRSFQQVIHNKNL